jgi:hypothetical protein
MLCITDFISRFFGRLQKRISISLRINTYEFRDGKIIKNIGPSRSQEIAIAEIVQWEVIHEMGFDIVILTTKDGATTQWIDYYDDLIGILKRHVPSLEHFR